MIHPHTYIHPNAKLAPNVKVDPFTVIHQDVEIGDGTWVGSNVTIMEGARIGKNCRIFPGAVISAIPQDLKFQGEYSNVVVGDGTTIREFVTINRGTKERDKTVIGKNCLIMAYCHFAHDCIVGDNCITSNNTQVAGHVTIGEWSILAGMCAVHQFVKIGAHAFISGGSLVSKDVPPFIKAGRTPLSYAGVNSIGLKRRGFSLERINHILDIYRVLYNKGMNTSQAVEYIEEEMPATDERDEIVTLSGKAAGASSNVSAKAIMMTISLSDAGKRYNRDWIFRHFNYQFEQGESYAITGPNGSGKSTLLQVLSGAMLLNEGICKWTSGNRDVSPEQVYRHISISAPYLELIEEMTMKEFLNFHGGFSSFLPGLEILQIAEIVGLKNAMHKQIRYYSSGMKQRLKLAQCILSDTPVILLDEPCTNLDADGVELYLRLVSIYGKDRLILVSSNDEVEYQFCGNRINVPDYK